MVEPHWEGIAEYLKTRITNGAAEALNGIIQTVKRKSRGFRSFEYFQAMIYLVASRLTFDHLPVPVPATHTKSQNHIEATRHPKNRDSEFARAPKGRIERRIELIEITE